MLYIGTASDTVWKVVTSQDIDTSQQDTIYITLSYRWGVKPQQLLLLSSNLQSLREGQPICDLPQTFKELIIVARQFGVWYVWIDALCIIQDSKEDWELEAPTMRQVYANAVCNIAATASDSPEGGLFRARIPRNLKPGLIHPSGLNGDEKSYYIWEKSVLERRIKHSPLHNRGWVFQERLLAPRVLYFANDQILWECMQTARCESFPNGIPYNSSLKSMDYILELTERAQDSLFKSVEAENPTERQPPEESGLFCSVHPEAAELWRSLVKQYTQCSLTVSHDRLPAFSGIARLFHEATGDDYYAGLWGGSLLLQLDWRVVNPAKRKVSSYRAPSWSWASVDGAVQLYGDMLGTRFLVSVIDINVRPTTHDSFGSVSSGYMTITGLLARATIQHYDDQFDTYQILTKDDAMEVQISPDTLDLDLSLGESIWYIPFKWYPVEFDTEREGMTVACLVVEPVLCTVAPLYRRLGIMSTSEYALDMGDVDWAMKPTIPDHYDERKSHSMDHYITIV